MQKHLDNKYAKLWLNNDYAQWNALETRSILEMQFGYLFSLFNAKGSYEKANFQLCGEIKQLGGYWQWTEEVGDAVLYGLGYYPDFVICPEFWILPNGRFVIVLKNVTGLSSFYKSLFEQYDIEVELIKASKEECFLKNSLFIEVKGKFNKRDEYKCEQFIKGEFWTDSEFSGLENCKPKFYIVDSFNPFFDIKNYGVARGAERLKSFSSAYLKLDYFGINDEHPTFLAGFCFKDIVAGVVVICGWNALKVFKEKFPRSYDFTIKTYKKVLNAGWFEIKSDYGKKDCAFCKNTDFFCEKSKIFLKSKTKFMNAKPKKARDRLCFRIPKGTNFNVFCDEDFETCPYKKKDLKQQEMLRAIELEKQLRGIK